VSKTVKITLTAKVRIEVGPAEQILLDGTTEKYREACNYVSDYVFRAHDLKMASLNDKLYYELRARFGLKSQMAQSVIKTVVARYKTILENQKKWIHAEFRTTAVRPRVEQGLLPDAGEVFREHPLGKGEAPLFRQGDGRVFRTRRSTGSAPPSLSRRRGSISCTFQSRLKSRRYPTRRYSG